MESSLHRLFGIYANEPKSSNFLIFELIPHILGIHVELDFHELHHKSPTIV